MHIGKESKKVYRRQIPPYLLAKLGRFVLPSSDAKMEIFFSEAALERLSGSLFIIVRWIPLPLIGLWMVLIETSPKVGIFVLPRITSYLLIIAFVFSFVILNIIWIVFVQHISISVDEFREIIGMCSLTKTEREYLKMLPLGKSRFQSTDDRSRIIVLFRRILELENRVNIAQQFTSEDVAVSSDRGREKSKALDHEIVGTWSGEHELSLSDGQKLIILKEQVRSLSSECLRIVSASDGKDSFDELHDQLMQLQIVVDAYSEVASLSDST